MNDEYKKRCAIYDKVINKTNKMVYQVKMVTEDGWYITSVNADNKEDAMVEAQVKFYALPMIKQLGLTAEPVEATEVF